MTAEAKVITWFDDFFVWILRVSPTDAVAGLARNGFVFGFSEFLNDVLVTLRAGFFAGEDRRARRQFLQCQASVPTVLTEGSRRQK